MSNTYSRLLLAFTLTFAIFIAGCGGDDPTPTPTPVAAAPLAQIEATATPVPPTPAPEPTAAPVVEEAAGLDLAALVDEYVSNIPDGFMNLSLDAFNAQMEATDIYLIDIREVNEYEAGHIPGAVNIPIRTLVDNLDQIPADQPVIIYCASGQRTGMALSALRMLGYDNVRAYAPGWRGWSAASGEVSTEATEPGSFTVPAIDAELVETVNDFISNIPAGFLYVGTVEGLQERMDAADVFLIDVRTEREVVETGMIPGAVHIDLRDLGKNLDQIPTDRPIIIYCATGFRASLALGVLQTLGYSSAITFPPGINAWLEADPDAAAASPAPIVTGEVADDLIIATLDEYLTNIPDGFMNLNNTAFMDLMDATDIYLIDIREVSDYEAGHIAGAVNIPIRTLAQNLDAIPTDQPVIIYCASGLRAGQAQTVLRALGYDNVRMFSAGWRGWNAAGEEASTEATEVGSFGVPDIAPELLAAADAYLSNLPDGFYGIQRVDQLDEMMEATEIFLLDVRTQAEVDETGVIPGAVHVDLRDLGKNFDQIPTEQPVVVYCKSGLRASLAGGALHMAGFENVRIFTPGIDGWLEAGMDAVSE